MGDPAHPDRQAGRQRLSADPGAELTAPGTGTYPTDDSRGQAAVQPQRPRLMRSLSSLVTGALRPPRLHLPPDRLWPRLLLPAHSPRQLAWLPPGTQPTLPPPSRATRSLPPDGGLLHLQDPAQEGGSQLAIIVMAWEKHGPSSIKRQTHPVVRRTGSLVEQIHRKDVWRHKGGQI